MAISFAAPFLKSKNVDGNSRKDKVQVVPKRSIHSIYSVNQSYTCIVNAKQQVDLVPVVACSRLQRSNLQATAQVII